MSYGTWLPDNMLSLMLRQKEMCSAVCCCTKHMIYCDVNIGVSCKRDWSLWILCGIKCHMTQYVVSTQGLQVNYHGLMMNSVVHTYIIFHATFYVVLSTPFALILWAKD